MIIIVIIVCFVACYLTGATIGYYMGWCKGSQHGYDTLRAVNNRASSEKKDLYQRIITLEARIKEMQDPRPRKYKRGRK